MVPNLQLHRGLAERGLLHGACQHAAGLQHREVVHGHKHKVVRHSTKPASSIHEHKGQVLVTRGAVALALPGPHAAAAQGTFDQRAPALTLVVWIRK